ncbi:IS3 family transposase [Bacillus cereus]|uniref:IS3 family transposase n=1 Tax=Bacillus cereus TaxID=1396 RepID=UPI0018A12AD0
MLREKIQQIFEEHKGRYGSFRITKVLEKKDIKINRKRVGRLIRQMKLYAKVIRYRYKRYNKKTKPLKLLTT